ncbi:MAG: phage tail tube protein [Pseudomonadota bacterium]
MTTDAYGRDVRLLGRRRSDPAVKETSGTFVLLPLFTATLGVNQPNTAEAKIPGDRLPADNIPDLAESGGTIETCADADALGWHLYQMFGAPQTTGSGDPYAHEFALAAGDLPIMDLRLEHGGLNSPLYEDHPGAVWNTMQIRVAKQGAAQRVNFGLLTRGQDAIGSSVAAGALEPSNNVIFRSWQGNVSVAGDAVGRIVGCDFTVSNGLQPDQGLLNQLPTPADYLLGDLAVSGTLRVRHSSDFYDALARSNGKVNITGGWTHAAGRSLAFSLHNAQLPRTPTNISNTGVIERDYPFALGRPDSGVPPVTVTLTNARADWDMPS